LKGKGDIKPKPKKLININPNNSNLAEKVVAEKDKKGKDTANSKPKNQWYTAEEENHRSTNTQVNSNLLSLNSFCK